MFEVTLSKGMFTVVILAQYKYNINWWAVFLIVKKIILYKKNPVHYQHKNKFIRGYNNYMKLAAAKHLVFTIVALTEILNLQESQI